MRNLYPGIIVAFIFFLLCALTIQQLWSLSTGAPPGFTGSYPDGYSACDVCHTGPTPTPVNGWITSNIPVTGYIPGNTYTVTATASGTGHDKFGFEVSPMDSFGNLIGTLIPTSSETQLTSNSIYITHTSSGTSGMNTKAWNFNWTAPAPGYGNVTFYGAFNVTNNDSSNDFDTIYTSNYTVQEYISSVVGEFGFIKGINVYPNPVTDHLKIHFLNRTPQLLNLSLFDINGRQVMEKKEAEQNGSGLLQWNFDHTLPPGVYLLNIDGPLLHTESKIIVMN
ncbi:MAG: T9SS type A sorting domain-containing protein [Bacteroidia bacterium]|nr:T9SS type A sorting domain-containing protein [Bacteroidia bacterium]